MVDKVQLIKEEIERRMHFCDGMVNTDFGEGVLYTLNKLKDFIDSLPEETASKDLEEEIDRCYKSRNDLMMTRRQFGELINHFAEWQRKKDQSTIELAEDHAMLAGMEKMREEMMKALINGEVVKDIHNQLSVKSEPLNDTFRDIKFGDKVKIIIIKEEQQ